MGCRGLRSRSKHNGGIVFWLDGRRIFHCPINVSIQVVDHVVEAAHLLPEPLAIECIKNEESLSTCFLGYFADYGLQEICSFGVQDVQLAFGVLQTVSQWVQG